MPVTVTKTVTLYTFAELDSSAKETARAWYRSCIDETDFDSSLEDFKTICELLGVELDTRPVKLMGGGISQAAQIFYSGFYSQGDGASFAGYYRYKPGAAKAIRAHAPQDKTLHKIAAALQAAQKRAFYGLSCRIDKQGRYEHSGCMRFSFEHDRLSDWPSQSENEIEQALRELADWLFYALQREYEYINSDECVDESILANEYTFNEYGKRED